MGVCSVSVREWSSLFGIHCLELAGKIRIIPNAKCLVFSEIGRLSCISPRLIMSLCFVSFSSVGESTVTSNFSHIISLPEPLNDIRRL